MKPLPLQLLQGLLSKSSFVSYSLRALVSSNTAAALVTFAKASFASDVFPNLSGCMILTNARYADFISASSENRCTHNMLYAVSLKFIVISLLSDMLPHAQLFEFGDHHCHARTRNQNYFFAAAADKSRRSPLSFTVLILNRFAIKSQIQIEFLAVVSYLFALNSDRSANDSVFFGEVFGINDGSEEALMIFFCSLGFLFDARGDAFIQDAATESFVHTGFSKKYF
jgi:hypothetical protein